MNLHPNKHHIAIPKRVKPALVLWWLFFLTAGQILAELRTNLEFAVVGGESLKLDVSIPAGQGPFTTVILVHGGGWSGGSKEVYISPLFTPLTEAGFTWFSINYRLAPAYHYPAAVEDVVTAVQWIKQHAQEFKVDPKRMVLVGESAGGHLVALVGARDGANLGLAGVVPYYPPCDFTSMIGTSLIRTNGAPKAISSFLGIQELNSEARRLLREASPVTYVNKDMPPFLLIHGDADPLVPYNQSLIMRERMTAVGAKAELYTVAGGGHGMNGWEKDPVMQAHKSTLVAWIKKVTLNDSASDSDTSKWISIFNGKDLSGWTARGKATWSVQDGILIGTGGMGHIYSDATCRDFEFKGMFRITEQGATANSGFYFRANPPTDDVNGFPRGYEAQICNSQDAYTGWLWKPGKPTGKATELLTKDGEWFSYRIRAVGPHIQFWINDKLVMTYDDGEYKTGHFAIQGHNPGMKIEAKELYYRDLSK